MIQLDGLVTAMIGCTGDVVGERSADSEDIFTDALSDRIGFRIYRIANPQATRSWQPKRLQRCNSRISYDIKPPPKVLRIICKPSLSSIGIPAWS